jgi:DMSO reductase family type II enzyme heme b subunit
MRVQKVDADDATLLDPGASDWSEVEGSTVLMAPTPIQAQPSMYVQAKWKSIPYGVLPEVTVKAAHNQKSVYFRLEWQDDSEDDGIRNTDQFVDAAAVLFPIADDAPLQSMGSPQQPVNAWFWRPDLDSPYSVIAVGTGTSRRTSDPALGARGSFAAGRWSVVLRRSFQADSQYVPLAPGDTRKVAFAVWQGANQERGGLKAATLEWQPLEIDG